MTRTLLTTFLAIIFASFGIGLAIYKWQMFQFPISPTEQFKSWYVELSVSVRDQDPSQRDALELTLLKPRDRSSLAVANPQLLARGFGIDEETYQYRLNKRRPDGRETMLLRFSLYELDANDITERDTSPAPAGRFHPSNRLSNPDDATTLFYNEVDRLLAEAKARSSSSVSLARELARLLKQETAATSLLQHTMEAPDRLSVIVELLRADKQRARVANGFGLGEANSSAVMQRWLEVRQDGHWSYFTMKNGELIPAKRYYAWWYGDRPLVDSSEGYNVRSTLSYKANHDGAFTRSLWLSQQENSLAYTIALQTLPLQQQMVLQVLLLLPLGALIVCFFRQIIGLQTLGTFMPVLIALALRETGLWYGIGFFASIVLIGLGARFYLKQLQLLMVPRLSAILSIVVLVIVGFMLLNKEQVLPLGISVALFPVVIITMFIERLFTQIDEQGKRTAFTNAMNSMFVAFIVYLCTMQPLVQHITFTFPEHLLVVLAIALMLGRYNGYKLLEYKRFWQLKRQIERQQKAAKGN